MRFNGRRFCRRFIAPGLARGLNGFLAIARRGATFSGAVFSGARFWSASFYRPAIFAIHSAFKRTRELVTGWPRRVRLTRRSAWLRLRRR
jgi:hypothetical protein